ncbi:MAG: UDP-glucose/GDP-mannose dehydrogenase family protein [Pseudomonadota bacterium]
MKIAVFGAGYVGVTIATCFAHAGNHVVCIDTDKQRIKQLNHYTLPIYEPELDLMLKQDTVQNKLCFTEDPRQGIKNAAVIFVAVGTPEDADGSPNLSSINQVVETIATYMDHYTVIVNKSTVPVGTADLVESIISKQLISRRKQGIEFDVVSNPEFLREGRAAADFMKPDRVILGTNSARAIKVLKQLYASFSFNHDKIIVMDRRSAEITKYAANAMLATKISFINEMSQIAEKVGADIEAIRRGIGADPRIGHDFIYPGCGYGGSCLPKDLSAIVHFSKDYHYTPLLINAVSQVNAAQKNLLFTKASDYFHGELKDKVFAVWGLAFKANTDDIRESSAINLIEKLLTAGAILQLFDPKAMANFDRLFYKKGGYHLCDTPEQAVDNADALFIMTEWSCFRSPDFQLLKAKLNTPVIFDGRNMYDLELMEVAGIDYYSIGRRAVCRQQQ